MSDYIIPSDIESRQKIINAVKEASDSKMRIDAENDLQKDIKAKMKGELGMPPKLFNTLVNAYYKRDAEERLAQSEEFYETYSVLFGNKDK